MIRTNLDGSRDKRFKAKPPVVVEGVLTLDQLNEAAEDIKKSPEVEEKFIPTTIVLPIDQSKVEATVSIGVVDPNELHTQFLADNNLELDFDVIEGVIPTKLGVIKLDKPTLVVKAKYVTSQ